MCIYVYVCVYVCIYVYICVYVCILMYICMYMYICVCMYISVFGVVAVVMIMIKCSVERVSYVGLIRNVLTGLMNYPHLCVSDTTDEFTVKRSNTHCSYNAKLVGLISSRSRILVRACAEGRVKWVYNKVLNPCRVFFCARI